MFGNIYKGKKILVTGHTGFKGSWMIQWLEMLGADVAGLSLPYIDHTPCHYRLLDCDVRDYYVDIRDLKTVKQVFKDFQPDFVFHMAAQSLVIPSYEDPIETWSSNVMGTAHVLEAMRQSDSVRGGVIITTDKCYKNKEQSAGYTETDELGGHDPYSASKAACELVIHSYRVSFFEDKKDSPLIASARAGNVIGGGDWSDYRIIPDIVRSLSSGTTLEIRNPQSTRPWQHVLESLSGYLLLGQKLLSGHHGFAKAYNFGPQENDTTPVIDIVDQFKVAFPGMNYRILTSETDKKHETQCLRLDSLLAVNDLSWHPVWNTNEGIKQTINWYMAYMANGDVLTKAQIDSYCAEAQSKKYDWALNQ